eukprot:TRINITY_DN24_c0_g1_i3.p1 TRINITY_DN24_c0_g1~~TRINITY_DN24_c0_g1_i3.p1  ORF type:complete len:525 (-),score=49.22 TRINITY_DN24_c0_g1_i3:1072-2646(-)
MVSSKAMSLIIFLGFVFLISTIKGVQFSESSNFENHIRTNAIDSQPIVTGVDFQGLLTETDSSINGSATRNQAASAGDDAVSGVEVIPLFTFSDVQALDVIANTDRNKATTTKGGKAIAGSLFAIGENNIPEVSIESVSTDNDAATDSGRAISGTQNLFGISNNSNVIIYNTADKNDANSLGFDPQDVISGTSNAFSSFSNGNITIVDRATRNDAESDKHNLPNGQTTSGSLFGAVYLDNSNINLTREARENIAQSNAGSAVSGIQTNIMQMNQSALMMNDTTQGNSAYGGKSSKAIAGTQTNVAGTFDSTITMNTNNSDNIAINEGSEFLATVAGSQFNVNNISHTTVDMQTYNVRNTAMSSSGPTVAGAQNNIARISGGSQIAIVNEAQENTAIVQNNGTAVSGVQNQIARISESDVTLNNTAINNVAKVYGHGDAISGTRTHIQSVEGSNITVDNFAKDNYAYANNGNAISGESLIIGSAIEESQINTEYYYSGNYANVNLGNAISTHQERINSDMSSIVN